MFRPKHLFVCGLLILAAACKEKSQKQQTNLDRPANFALNKPADAARGELLEASHLISFSREELNEKLKNRGISARNGIHIYKVQYQTETPVDKPQPIVASGIIVLPDVESGAFPWISLQHGTIVGKVDAPSVTPLEGLIEGSQGYLTVVMDYLGYGSSSEVFHPYVIAESYADAGVDILRAARKFAAQNAIELGPLFLKGYSEGGYATLALQKALETEYRGEFPLFASAPAAGPYDLEQSGRILLGQPDVDQVNLPFVVLSYNYWRSKGGFDLNRVFKPEAQQMQQLFSGAFRSDEIYRQLPNMTEELFEEDLLAQMRVPEAASIYEAQKLKTWLSAESLHNKGWIPSVKTKFYHCEDDKTVPVEATKEMLKVIDISINRHVEGEIIRSPDPANPYTHRNCPALFSSLQWFATLLEQEN